MDNIGHKIVDIIDDYTELFSDTPDFNHVETLSQNICLMQITQAMPEAFGRDVIKSCPNGLHSEHCEMEAVALWAIVCGDMEIVKLPWKPKKGDVYYTFELLWGKWVVRSLWWAGVPCNYALLDKGWVFRTKEEAKAALPKVAAEMGVEYEL